MICVSQDLYPSALYLKFNAVPGALSSKFTTPEKSNIWSWLCDPNVKLFLVYNSCTMVSVFR